MVSNKFSYCYTSGQMPSIVSPPPLCTDATAILSTADVSNIAVLLWNIGKWWRTNHSKKRTIKGLGLRVDFVLYCKKTSPEQEVKMWVAYYSSCLQDLFRRTLSKTIAGTAKLVPAMVFERHIWRQNAACRKLPGEFTSYFSSSAHFHQ